MSLRDRLQIISAVLMPGELCTVEVHGMEPEEFSGLAKELGATVRTHVYPGGLGALAPEDYALDFFVVKFGGLHFDAGARRRPATPAESAALAKEPPQGTLRAVTLIKEAA